VHVLISQATKSKVSFAFDGWASKWGISFLGLTAHYIDRKWRMKRQLLHFDEFPNPHTGDRIATRLLELLEYYRLERKFFGLTGDSASNNTLGKRLLADKLRFSKRIEWSHMENFFHCSAHVFNLIAQAFCSPFVQKVVVNGQEQEIVHETDGLDAALVSGNVSSALSKISRMANKASYSSFNERWEYLGELIMPGQSRIRLVKSSPTRWNSRLNEIKAALRMRPVYEAMTSGQYSKEYTDFALSDREWKALKWICRFLEAINFACNRLSASTKVSISFMIPCFTLIGNLLDKYDDEALANLDEEVVLMLSANEKMTRREALRKAREKLDYYYRHTTENPWYTFGTSELHQKRPFLHFHDVMS
jgi:hypothetical protein